jgi:hypothetical protein
VDTFPSSSQTKYLPFPSQQIKYFLKPFFTAVKVLWHIFWLAGPNILDWPWRFLAASILTLYLTASAEQGWCFNGLLAHISSITCFLMVGRI